MATTKKIASLEFARIIAMFAIVGISLSNGTHVLAMG